jgi:DNA-binding transcriptional ArsR family regulator
MEESTETEAVRLAGIVTASRGMRARELTPQVVRPENRIMEERLEREVNQLHASICQALADPKRILILYELHEGPKTVTELTEALKVPQPTVSRHLKMLREQRLVTNERDGVSIRYSLADDRVIDALDTMRAVLIGGLAQQAELAEGLT